MSKIITLIATSAVAVTLATSAVADSKCLTGFYVGGNFGYGAGTDKTQVFSNRIGANVSKERGMKGAVGGLHLGFQKDFGQIIAGLEGSASLSNTKGSDSIRFPVATVSSTFKRKNALGVAGRLGVKINSWQMYAKLGYENAKFSSIASVGNLSFGNSKRLNAFVPGVGFETMLCNNVLVGGEWTYSMYQGKNFNKNGIGTDKHKPRIGDFKLRLGYKF